FRHSRIDDYGAVMVAEAQRLTDGWRDGQELDVNRDMMRLTLVIVGRTLFDAVLEGDAAAVGEALTQVLKLFERITNPFGALLDRLPLPATERFRRAQQDLDTVIARMIAERRASTVDGSDLLSILI